MEGGLLDFFFIFYEFCLKKVINIKTLNKSFGMFARDIYTHDFVMRYYPKYQLDHFERDMFQPSKRLLHSVVLSPEEQKIMIGQAATATGLTIGCLTTSIIALFLYNRIPLINRVQKRGKRIVLKCLMILVPYIGVSAYTSYQNTKFLVDSYEKFKMDYKKYKENGDIKALNPKVIGIFTLKIQNFI